MLFVSPCVWSYCASVSDLENCALVCVRFCSFIVSCTYSLNFSARHSLNFLVGLECTISWICGHETDYIILYYSILYWLMLSDPCSTVIPLSTQSQLLKYLMPRIENVPVYYFLNNFSFIISKPCFSTFVYISWNQKLISN